MNRTQTNPEIFDLDSLPLQSLAVIVIVVPLIPATYLLRLNGVSLRFSRRPATYVTCRMSHFVTAVVWHSYDGRCNIMYSSLKYHSHAVAHAVRFLNHSRQGIHILVGGVTRSDHHVHPEIDRDLQQNAVIIP